MSYPKKSKQKPKVMTLVCSPGRVEAVAMAIAFSSISDAERREHRAQATIIIEALRVGSVR